MGVLFPPVRASKFSEKRLLDAAESAQRNLCQFTFGVSSLKTKVLSTMGRSLVAHALLMELRNT